MPDSGDGTSLLQQIAPPPQKQGNLLDQINSGDEQGPLLSQIQTAPLLDQISQEPPSTEAPAPVLRGWELLGKGVQYLGEQIGHSDLGAAFDVGAAAGTNMPYGGQALAKSFQFAYPALGHAPTMEDMQLYAGSEPRFTPVWDALKQAQQDANARADQKGGKPDWDAAFQAHLTQTYQDVKAKWDSGAKPSPDDPFPQVGDTEGMLRYARQTAVPGQDVAPPSDQQIADAGYSWVKAKNEQELQQLPYWVRKVLSGGVVGAGASLVAKAFPPTAIAQAVAGAAYEAATQGLQIASGRQRELDPGQILLQGALMGAATKAGALAQEAFPLRPAAAAMGGQISAFEAAGALQKAVEAVQQGGKRQQPSQEEDVGTINALVSHILGVAAGAGIAAKVAGGGERPEAMGNAEATYITAQAMSARLKAAENAKAAGLEQRVRDTYAPIDAAAYEAQDKLKTAIDKAAPGDTELQQKLEVAARVAVELEGVLPEPIATGLKNEKLGPIIEATKEAGASFLPYGKRLYEIGKMPWARYQVPGQTEDVVSQKEGDATNQNAAQNPSWKLVGGFKYAQERGFYFPQIEAKAQPNVEPPGGPSRTPGAAAQRAPFRSELGEGHLQKRELPFDQAYAERPLDLTMRKAMEVFSAESEMVKRHAFLDLARQEGLLVPAEKLPDAAAKQQMALDATKLKAEIRSDIASIQNFPVQDRIRLRQQIYEKQARLAEMTAASKDNLYKLLKGKEWGEFEGSYLHRDALSRYRVFSADPGAAKYLWNAVHTLGKAMRVAFDPSQYLQDFLSDWRMVREAGIRNVMRRIPDSWAADFQGQKTKNDYLFDAYSKGDALGGPSDYTAADTAEVRQIGKLIRENEKQGKGAKALKLAQVIQRRGELIQNMNAAIDRLPGGVRQAAELAALPVNVAMLVPRFRQRLIDLAFARAAFHEVIENGTVLDPGPKSPEWAYNYVSGAMSHRSLPQAVQKASGFFSFLRWRAKFIQSTVTRAGLQPLSVLGVPFDTPLDSVIRTDPGSPQAQAALFSRGMLRVGLNVGEAILATSAMQTALAHRLGISQADLDKRLDAKFSYLPAPVAWLAKKGFLPLTKNNLGEVEGVDTGRFFPEMVVARYFSMPNNISALWKNPVKGTADLAYWLAGKNIIGAPVEQAATKQDFMGNPVKPGFGPGESNWPLISMFLPALPMRSIEEYARQQNLPPPERQALEMNFLKTMVGVPVSVLHEPAVFTKEVQRLYEEGTIGREVGPDGSWHFVPIAGANTLEGQHARAILQQAQNETPDYAAAVRKMYHQQQKFTESFQK